MRPRTLARKKLQPIFKLFKVFGDCTSVTGYSYTQNAISRAAWAINKGYESYIVVCAILYDLDELILLSEKHDVNKIFAIEKDKQAREFIKLIFNEEISKPLRLKSVAQHYGRHDSKLDSSTVQLFEESPWFFSSMVLYQLNKKLSKQTNSDPTLVGDILDYEETLLSQTLILYNRDKTHA